MSTFKKATRTRVFLKLGITGAAGTGKTTAALRLATGLADGGQIAFLDTENESGSLYAETYNFDVINLSPPFTPEKFTSPIDEAVKEGYKVLIIDSFSHVWTETLDFKAGLDSKPGSNSYTNWNAAGKKFGNVLAKLLHSPIHTICCMRSKMDYVLETDDKGKQKPRKVGLAPIMRDGIEFEFTSVFDIGLDHFATVSKDRTRMFIDQHLEVTEDTGCQLLNWLNSAPMPQPEPVVPPPAPPAPPPAPPPATNGVAQDFTHEGTIEIATQYMPNSKGKACYGAELDGTKVYTFDSKLGELLLSLDNLPAKLNLRPTGRPGYFEILDIEVPEPTPADTGEDQDPF